MAGAFIFHKDSPPEHQHGIAARFYANSAARLADTNFTDPQDLWKVAVDDDTNNQFLLTQITPSIVWIDLGNATPGSLNKVEISVKKATAGTLTKGTLVRATGTDGSDFTLVEAALSDPTGATLPCVGMVSETADNVTGGKVMVLGRVSGISTLGIPVSYPVYVSSTIAGGYTYIPPAGPNIVQPIGVVLKSSPSGIIGVNPVGFRSINYASTPSVLGAAAAGTSNLASPSDHIHGHGDLAGGSLHAAATPLVDGFISASDKTKLDGVATGATNTPLSGSVPVNVSKSAGSAGSISEAARGDHKHDITTGVAVAVGTANTEGTSTFLARADHTHQVTGLVITGEAQGDILYRNASAWVRLAPGTAGQRLQTNGAGANPSWVTPSTAITNQQITATTDTSTTSASFVVMNSMTVTPAAGTYIVTFSSSGNTDFSGVDCDYALFLAGTIIQHTFRQMNYGGGGQSSDYDSAMYSQAIITVTGSETIDVRYRSSNGSVFVHERSLILVKVA